MKNLKLVISTCLMTIIQGILVWAKFTNYVNMDFLSWIEIFMPSIFVFVIVVVILVISMFKEFDGHEER